MSEKNVYDLLMNGDDMPNVIESSAETYRTLGSQELGDVVTLGGMEYIVLEHTDDGYTAVVTKGIARYMPFGENADYSKSKIRAWLNHEFRNELVEAVGEGNILKHAVDLTAEDGTSEMIVEDFVSILTAQRYRKYRRFLSTCGQAWWVATRASADLKAYRLVACYVEGNGVLNWNAVSEDNGVRPFCFLKSSIIVD